MKPPAFNGVTSPIENFSCGSGLHWESNPAVQANRQIRGRHGHHRVIAVQVPMDNLEAVDKVKSLFLIGPSILLLAMVIYMACKTQKEVSFAGFDWILDTLRVRA